MHTTPIRCSEVEGRTLAILGVLSLHTIPKDLTFPAGLYYWGEPERAPPRMIQLVLCHDMYIIVQPTVISIPYVLVRSLFYIIFDISYYFQTRLL